MEFDYFQFIKWTKKLVGGYDLTVLENCKNTLPLYEKKIIEMLIFPIQFRFSSLKFCFKMHCLLEFGIILSPSKKNSHAENEKKTGLKRKVIK